MEDTYDDKNAPPQRLPDELPPVRIGEIGEDTPRTPEHRENLRERLPDPGFDNDDTIGDLPLVRRNPDTQIDEPPSGDDTPEKTD